MDIVDADEGTEKARRIRKTKNNDLFVLLISDAVVMLMFFPPFCLCL
jgi:hypothetical protein